jgi:hypothetical protein
MAMSAIRALLGKELRQHGGAVGLGTLLLGVAWVVAQLSFSQAARTLTMLQLVSGFALFPLAAASLWLGHRLVVTEYYARTQRFVEALPLHRGLPALTKAAFGLVVLEAWAMLGLAAGAWGASHSEGVGLRFLGIMAARLGGFVFALWGVVFLLGFFGRLRVALAGAIALLVLGLDHATTWTIERFGPFALIDPQTFGLERHQLPGRALLEAAALGALCLAGGWALARIREGSVVEALARPLSTRELTALAAVALIAVGVFTTFAREASPRPYQITGDEVVRRLDVPLVVAHFDDDLRAPAQRLSDTLGPTLVAFTAALAWPEPLPPVRVVHAPDADPGDPDSELVDPVEGLVVGVNLRSGAERPVEVAAFVLHQLVWARTRGRAGFEPRHWLLDGFSYHFALHGAGPAPPLSGAPDPWLLRALVAHEAVPVSVEALARYHVSAERLGDPGANALAASGWRVLEARLGRRRVLELARAAFGRRGTADVRDYLFERRHPADVLFARATGLPWESFVADWGQTLTRLAREPGVRAQLAQLPRGRLDVLADGLSGRVSVAGALDPPPGQGTFCSLWHQRLWSFDAEVSTHGMERTRFLWTEGDQRPSRELEAAYGSGERVFVALDCEIPALGFPVRLLSRRVTVP